MAETPYSENPVITDIEITSDTGVIGDDIQVKSILVKKEVNKIPYARIVLYDWDQQLLDFKLSNTDTFKPGAKIVISAGYDGNKVQIFKGVVIRHRINAGSESAPVLEVECRDAMLKMTIGRKNAYYSKTKDSDIISTLISNGGGSASVDATTVQHDELVQYNCSDWDFMLARAEVNGLVVIVDDGATTVKKPAIDSTAVLTCTYGSDLYSFDGELDAERQLSKVQATAWDVSKQENVQVSISSATVNAQGDINSATLAAVLGVSVFDLQTTGVVTEDDLTQWAKAQVLKSWMARISGSASFKGSSDVRPGCIIEFKKVGNRLSGNAYISSVEHSIEEGNWVTTVEMGLKPEWFSERVSMQSPIAAGLAGGVSGLMIGKVKQLDSDPGNQFRVMLTLPSMRDESDGIWARLAGYYATSGAGSFFIPELGDEVVVGFLNGDPRAPMVLGSLYSSTRKAPNDLTKENYTKAIITKGLNKIGFDDENKIITITTPGNNQAIMNDKEKSVTVQDQHSNSIVLNSDGITIKDKSGNKIVMSSGGIEINSASNVKIVAAQDIKASATANIDLSATQNVSVSGLQISNSANTAFKATGNASAEISAAGQTTIKGAMVMIN